MLDHLRFARSRIGAVLIAILLVSAVGACAGATAPSAAAPSPAAPSPAPGASDAPDEPTASPSDGTGIVPPDGAKLVVPRPGQLNVHPVSADRIEAQVDGRHVELTVTWTSGVEPCSILDSIVVDQEPGSFAITLREGSGPGEPVCIAIAETHQARIDLGDLEPGTYVVRDATDGAAPIEVVVS